MAETLNDLTIKNTAYHVSDSANADDANGNPASDPKTVTHASDGKKIWRTLATEFCKINY